MQHTPSARDEFVAGLRAFLPLIMSNAPLGMVCGAAAIAAGMTPLQASAMSWAIFAGSSQIVAAQLLVAGAPFLVIVATATVVNLRFMMYSAALSPFLGHLGRRWQLALAYLLTDQPFALGLTHYMQPGETRHRHWFMLGLASAIWVCWQLATLAGILLGSLIPAHWSIDFVLPLTFIAIVVPMLKDRSTLAAALVGGGASVLLTLPLKLNLMAATLLGILTGMLVDRFWATRPNGTPGQTRP